MAMWLGNFLPINFIQTPLARGWPLSATMHFDPQAATNHRTITSGTTLHELDISESNSKAGTT
jgi:hypothetical protein